MKKITLLTLIAVATTLSSFAQIVNIPDANFKANLVGNNNLNTNQDSEIQVSEAVAYTGLISCANWSISDLTGIEEFPNVTELWVENNQLTSVDLSNNTQLTSFYCQGNQLTTLDVSMCTGLIYLQCQNNQLTALNVETGNNTGMFIFNATNNPNLTCIQVDDVSWATTNWTVPTNIDATASFSADCGFCTVNIPDANFKSYLVGNTGINTNMDTEIQCSEADAFTGTIDITSMSVSDVTGLEAFVNVSEFNCPNNSITSLDLTPNAQLTDLNCGGNGMTSLILNDAIEVVTCANNNITALDLSNKSNLLQLYCQLNSITSLDLSDCIDLGTINCNANNLTTLDVTVPTLLNQVICDNNNITSLTLGTQATFWKLTCGNNLLTDLDVSACPAIQDLRCSYNDDLVTLNVANGNNSNFTFFLASDNASLTCIKVDDAAWSTSNWASQIDAGASFSEDCFAGIEENTMQLELYPNPVQETLTIKVDSEVENVNIYSIDGTFVRSTKGTLIDVQDLNDGQYLIKVQTATGSTMERITKI